MGLKAWYFTLREECTPKVSDSRVLRKIFGPKRDVLKRGSGKDYIMGSLCLYSSPNIVQVIKSRILSVSQFSLHKNVFHEPLF